MRTGRVAILVALIGLDPVGRTGCFAPIAVMLEGFSLLPIADLCEQVRCQLTSGTPDCGEGHRGREGA